MLSLSTSLVEKMVEEGVEYSRGEGCLLEGEFTDYEMVLHTTVNRRI